MKPEDFQNEDIVGIQWGNNRIEYGCLFDINLEERTAKFRFFADGSEFEVHDDKWKMLFPYGIESKVF